MRVLMLLILLLPVLRKGGEVALGKTGSVEKGVNLGWGFSATSGVLTRMPFKIT